MPVSLPPDLDSLIGQFPQFVQDELRKDPHLGIRLEVETVAGPMRNGCLGWLLRRPTDTPKLGVMVSKYGGYPYLEDKRDWPFEGAGVFLGQLNFAELPTAGTSLPGQGMLVLFYDYDGPASFRWYPEPDEAKAIPVQEWHGHGVGTWECSVSGKPMASINPGVLESAEWNELSRKDADLELLGDRMWDWLWDDGPTVGIWPLDRPDGSFAPYRRVGEKKRVRVAEDASDWIELWRPFARGANGKIVTEYCDSFLVIRRSDLEAGRIDRCEAWWQ